MIYLHKILPWLVSPIAVVVFFLVMGLLFRKRSFAFLALLVLLIASNPLVAGFLYGQLERGQIRLSAEDAPEADAIVVLSGMLNPSPGRDGIVPEWGGAVDRFWGGLELIRAEKAGYLIFTGGAVPWIKLPPEGEYLREKALEAGIAEEIVLVTSDVQNTSEEAYAVREILDRDNPEIILVTSAFHMPRAKALFEQQGFAVFPYPVDFKISDGNRVTFMSFLPSEAAFSKTQQSIREFLGRLYYSFRTSQE
ncbi:YdcF family protein [Kiloniella sp. b19]|uniref:YdcF family protein n=1 Tax=Kiloniella sp. GXU_MW_B19 TaxID=3141326 RepID=UPI0031DCADBB